MNAGFIWYRTRPGEAAYNSIKDMLSLVDCEPKTEEMTIRPEDISGLLSRSLRQNAVTVFSGGMELLRESENLIFILSRCLSLQLETGRKSRSKYVYDTLRSVVLPSFEQAVMFPTSVENSPEGVLLMAGGQAVILLPADDDAIMQVCASMGRYLGSLRTKTEKEQEEKEIAESPLPDYVERIMRNKAKEREERERLEKEREPARTVFDGSELKLMMMPPEDIDRPMETNVVRRPQQPHQRPVASRTPVYRDRQPAPSPRDDGFGAFAPGREWEEEKRTSLLERISSMFNPPEDPRQREIARMRLTGHLRVASVVLTFAVIAGLCVIAFKYYRSGIIDNGEQYMSELNELYCPSDSTGLLPDGAVPDFARLYALNARTAGFITIGGELAQPVLVPPEDNPGYYENHDFYGHTDRRGSLRFDKNNIISSTYDNPNIIIYGNNAADGSQFAVLENYLDRSYFAENPIISMDTLYDKEDWLVFAVCVVSNDTVSSFNYADTSFQGAYTNEVYLYNLFIRSMFYTSVEVFPGDRLLTLVTDSDEFTGAKLLVCARQMREEDSVDNFAAGVMENDLVLMPDIWYAVNGGMKPVIPQLEVPTLYDKPTETTTTSAPETTTTTAAPTTTASAVQPGQETVETTTTTTTTTTTAPTTTTTTLPPSTTVKNMRVTSNGRVIDDSAVNVLAMIIEAEMGGSYNMEALKAQGVAAYTYYLYSGGRSKAPSFSTKAASSKSREAAEMIVGQYMTIDGRTPYTPYFATSAGMTASNADINGSQLSYLVAVDCAPDKDDPGYKTVKTVSASVVAQKVLLAKGIDLTAIEDKTKWFEIAERDDNGLYVKTVKVGGEAFRGNTLHLSILGYNCLRSPCFDIEYTKEDDSFVFTSYGYGTGVGMSQTGANAYAAQGKSYVWILEHFYTGVKITK